MQRYRINYHWLIGVFVTALVLAVSAYFVWSWQVNRKAGYFLTLAEQAMSEGKTFEALESYGKYMQLRPDENDVRVKMGQVAVEVVKDDSLPGEERSMGLGTLDQCVRMTGDTELRRELANIYLAFRPQDSRDLVRELLLDSPEDPELNAMLVRALFQSKEYGELKEHAYKIIGYDKLADEFNPDKALLKGQSDVYALLADVLIQNDSNVELAERVVEAMVDANPEDADAYLRKSLFLSTSEEDEEAAQEALDKAYELDPKNAAVISRMGMVALDDEDFEKAEQLFARGIEEHPDNPLFYRLMAETQYRLERPEQAMEVLETGIRKLDKLRAVDLVIYKIDLLFADGDFSAVDREIEWIQRLNRPDLMPLIDFEKARISYSKQDWLQASRELSRVRPLLVSRPRVQAMAGTMLGASYERLGSYDLALEAYNTVLSAMPTQEAARQGRERILARLRPQDEEGVELDQVLNATLELPKNEQDWDKVEEVLQQVVEKNELGPAATKLLRAKVLIKREMFDEAKALIRSAADDEPDNLSVQFTAILLVLSDPEQGAPAAMRLLDRLENRWGRSLRSMTLRADLLIQLKPDDVEQQLRFLTSNMEELSEAEQTQLIKVIGLRFEQLGNLELAQEFLGRAVELEPTNLPLRMYLFDLALRSGSDEAMQKAQQAVLDFVKSENDPAYVLTEVKRQIMRFGRRQISREELAATREMLDKALRLRPDWHELHIAYGQLLLMLNKDLQLAMKHFDDALESGPARANAVATQVKLLADQGLYRQARERMELLDEELRTRLLGQKEAEILIATGDEEAGFDAAQEIADASPNDLQAQIWFSRIAQQQGKLDSAAKVLRHALDLNPSDPDNWLRLIGLYAEQKQYEGIEASIRDAHLSVDAEFLPLLTAKYFELLSRWRDAERVYLAYYEERLDDLSVARRMADFYLLWSNKDPTNVLRAAPYINQILKAANDGEVQADNPHVVWARQRAARVLSASNDYQQSLKAERLLRQSAGDDGMSLEESELLVDILVSRNDPKSLMQAKQLLLELRSQDRLGREKALQLARILSQTKEWDLCKELMLDLIPEYPNDTEVFVTYVDLLIEEGEYANAERALRQLRDKGASGFMIVQLTARLASKRGDDAGLKQVLTSITPNLRGSLNATQLKTVLAIAQLATQYGAYDIAQEMYETYTSRTEGNDFELARFMALHGDPERAIELMRRLLDEQTEDVIQLANNMLVRRRREFGDKYDEAVTRLVDQALREDPESVNRQMVQAEVLDAQEKYEESIAAYEKVLARTDLPKRARAAAMNNLGFQFALLGRRLDEADQLINRAMETFGPVEDMLDTRAIVYIQQGKYELAIEDMLAAVSVSKDPVKYFHLAKAYILAGDGQSATEAWETARELGFEKAQLTKLEQATYDEIVQKIEAFQSQNAGL